MGIPRSLVPDSIVLTAAEPKLEVYVSANTANVKWLSFTNGGYFVQDGAAGAITSNSWVGDYWTAVLEKALDYYGFAEVLSLRVCAQPPALHVAG